MRIATVDRMMCRALAQRAFQSACLLVASDEQPTMHRPYGKAELDSVFDLASLTKPLATTAVLMRLCERGDLTLDTSLGALVSELRAGPWADTPLWQLLSHSAGLVAWRPFYAQVNHLSAGRARARVRQLLRREAPEYPAASRSLYSDLGFMLLGWAIERRSGRRLDHLAAELVYRPLGLSHTGFIDLRRSGAPTLAHRHWHIAPTERLARQARLHGQVHDDNCRAMGGVEGHAGLFSNASDVHVLVRELVSAYRGERSIFAPHVVRQFFAARPVPGSSWALGWDTPGGGPSSSGRCFGANSVGHLGFTGTSVWVDLERPLWVILLTNRVYYGREPNPMKQLRPRLHDCIWRALA